MKDLLASRTGGQIDKLEFAKLFLESKSCAEGTSRRNLLFLVETLKNNSHVQRKVEEVKESFTEFEKGLLFLSKFQIHKNLVKIKKNILICGREFSKYFQDYLGNPFVSECLFFSNPLSKISNSGNIMIYYFQFRYQC